LYSFIRLAVDATKISLRNHVKFEVIGAQGHPRSSTLMPIESTHTRNFLLVINSNFGLMLYSFRDIDP